MNPSNQRIESIDVLRGLFALSIMVYHCLFWSYENQFLAPQGVWRIIDWLGIYGVESFFVISALSLSHVYGRTRLHDLASVKDYFWKRVVRLWPLFTLAVLVATGFRLLNGEPPVPTDLALNLTLMFGFVDAAKSAVIGGWSIGVEVVLYAAFPLIVWLTRHWRPTLLFLLVASFAAMMLWQDRITGNIMDPFLGSLYVHPVNHLFFFVAGCLAYEVWQAKPKFSPSWSLAIVTLTSGLIWVHSTNQTDIVTGWKRALFAVLVVTICWSVKPLRLPVRGADGSRPLFAAALLHLGAISYSVYLMHPFLYQGLKLIGATPLQMAVGTVILTPIVASGVYRWLEQPMIGWGKGVSQKYGWSKTSSAVP
ncbi:MAG: acyltransferase [Fimbriimonadaceae bacterium]|nr:acyltransferase [Fimbriimonadaceae bacterium]